MVQYVRNMTKKTITKFFAFVIFFVLIAGIFLGCSSNETRRPESAGSPHYYPPKKVGNLVDSEIEEASGLAASRCSPGVLWTHNDSGDGAFIYGISTTGAPVGTWKVPGATNVDWEDIAEFKDRSGKCFLYIGEIGDNRERMTEHAIYRVPEPTVSADAAGTRRKNALTTEPADVLRFTYPDGAHNAETLMVDPRAGSIYVVTKNRRGPASVYRLRPEFNSGSTLQAEKITDFSIPAIFKGLITGGDISPDGRRMMICDYVSGYEYSLPEGSDRFDDVWGQKPETVDLGDRPVGEAVCYSPDGNSLFATSEGVGAAIYESVRKN